MKEDTYPRFRAAAVQAAPAFLDRDATIARVEEWVARAADRGADLVVFGESFVPAFPVWNLILPPIDQHGFFRRLYDNAVEIPGPDLERLAGIARGHSVFLSVGVTEKSPLLMGTMWNTNLVFGRDGALLNRHRKLVPTWAEKLTWANGDASGLVVQQTELGRIGTLICGENTNTLARFALLASGEQVHISTYPPVWPVRREAGRNYNLTDSIRIRAAAHAFEGKVFNVVASCVADAQTISELSMGDPELKALLESSPPPVSMIVGPDGQLVGEPLVGEEGMVIGELDLGLSIGEKPIHDITGGYNRFDVFHLEVNRSPNQPVWGAPQGPAAPAVAGGHHDALLADAVAQEVK